MEYIEKRYPTPNEKGVIGLVFEPKPPKETEPDTWETVRQEAETSAEKASTKQKKKA